MKILVVDDDRSLREALRRALTVSGYAVTLAENGQQALTLAASAAPDALVLDVGLPDLDGLEVCRRLRGAHNRVPVLMLTARVAVEDRIDGLDAGADDYLTKPFDTGELMARVRALLRRGVAPEVPDQLVCGDLRVDGLRHGFVVGDTFVELTRTEYKLLELFVLNADHVLTREVIHDRVWGYDFGETANGLRVYIGYLRRKLEQAGATPTIQTLRGLGYVLRPQ